jgi:hypothetical protein
VPSHTDSPLDEIPDPVRIDERLSAIEREADLLRRLQKISVAAQRERERRGAQGGIGLSIEPEDADAD